MRRSLAVLSRQKDAYFRCGSAVLKYHKILQVNIRPSLFWVWYPYVMELTYAKQWSESYMIGTGKVMFPMTDHHDTKKYSWKYKRRCYNHLVRVKNQLEEQRVPVEFTITHDG